VRIVYRPRRASSFVSEEGERTPSTLFSEEARDGIRPLVAAVREIPIDDPGSHRCESRSDLRWSFHRFACKQRILFRSVNLQIKSQGRRPAPGSLISWIRATRNAVPPDRVQRWPNTNGPLVNIGIAFRTRARLCVLPTTTRGVPMWTRSKNRAARSLGIRTQPWDAGYPGR
jgi:hypothetical protein